MQYETVKTLAAVLGTLAAIVISVGILHRQVISPWIAKPIAQGVKNELKDYIEVVLFTEPMITHLRELVQEEVTSGNSEVINLLIEHDRRLKTMERKQDKILNVTEGLSGS